MPDQESGTRQCPFCKEYVKEAAIRCKHCQAALAPAKPDHQGVCPLCKEDINVEATRCMHCKADLVTRGPSGCGCCQETAVRQMARRATAPAAGRARARRAVPRRPGRSEPSYDVARDAGCEGCADTDTDEEGTWTFLECSEHYCIYELTDPVPVSPYGVFR